MTTQAVFPTLLHCAPLDPGGGRLLRERLLRECRQLRKDDSAGRRWSARNYPGGFTSYASANRMHQISPTFAALERKLAKHIARLSRALDFDLTDRPLAMTDCWVNIMPRRVAHGLHLHPLSTFSGIYYVKVPRNGPGLKLEDPRLDRYMAAPPRLAKSRLGNRPWIMMPAKEGHVLLFESWLRHEVVPNPSDGERISISFNYSWF